MDAHDSDNRFPRSRRLDDLRGADGQAITAHGYPAAADTSKINYPMTILLLSILVIFVTLVYAPIAAWLVELFPTRIRYSGLSLPYHMATDGSAAFCPRSCSPSWQRPAISIPVSGTRS
jgi:hypothetical protein